MRERVVALLTEHADGQSIAELELLGNQELVMLVVNAMLTERVVGLFSKPDGRGGSATIVRLVSEQQFANMG
jgi:hypothetical protein